MEGVAELNNLRKNIERPFNLLKHREGVEPVRVRSQAGVIAVTTFANTDFHQHKHGQPAAGNSRYPQNKEKGEPATGTKISGLALKTQRTIGITGTALAVLLESRPKGAAGGGIPVQT